MTTFVRQGASSPCAAGSLYQLENLPGELLQLVVACLSTADLRKTALTSRALHRHATDILWQHVCLVDKRTPRTNDLYDEIEGEYERIVSDEHDDSPIIEKLYILATNPGLASKVQTLTHRCHLPSPNIFAELPRLHFDAEHLSADRRLHDLLRLAIRNLINVHTLRIVYGHWHLTNVLLDGFLDQARPRKVPLRKLWLESCSFDIRSIRFLNPTQATGLESIRLRRLRAEAATACTRHDMAFGDIKLARGGHHFPMHNGAGAWVDTTVEFSPRDLPEPLTTPTPEDLAQKARNFDDSIWAGFQGPADYANKTRIDCKSFADVDAAHLPSSMHPMQWLFQSSQSTLTKLDLDWVLWRRRESDNIRDDSSDFLTTLSSMRFPHLVAFQVRNAVLPLTRLPDDIFLLEDTFLAFLEAHPKIKCLAWPLDKIYSHRRPTVEIQSKCRRLISQLATILTDLRLDTPYAGSGEPTTDDSSIFEASQQRVRRRRFIMEFAPYMRKIKRIKLEGGIPRDEKREILRALNYCPLEKIVFIGVSFPIGNTWGHRGAHLKLLDGGPETDLDYDLEEEDSRGMLQAYQRRDRVPDNFTFEPAYGWEAQAPLLHTLALHHADNIQELKICGYNGCPVLSYPTSDSKALMAPLLQYHSLRQLVVSFWLLTYFEGSYRDTEIIQSWLDTRSPSSTALVIVTPPRSPERDYPVDGAMMPAPNPGAPQPEFNRWDVALRTRFTPSALAYRVASDIGPFLSHVAKAQPGGVRVRASFCLGAREPNRTANDIFDLDMRIGKDNDVLEFVGPREEVEKGRWWAKMEGRMWF